MELDNDYVCRRRYNLRTVSFEDVKLTLPSLSPCGLEVNFAEEEQISISQVQNGCKFPFSIGNIFEAAIIDADNLTCGSDVKKVLSLHLDTKISDVQFNPGDTVAILPCNFDAEVEEFSQLLGVKDILFKTCIIQINEKLKRKSQFQHIPVISSFHNILKSCVDIRAVPKKALLRVLVEHASDEHEKRCLQVLCSREGSSVYDSYILKCSATILDVLSAFPSCKPPIGRILEQLPRLMPRPYSIASSPLVSPHEVHIVLSVEEKPVVGLCSGWLYNLVKPLLETNVEQVERRINELHLSRSNKPSLQVPMFFRKSTSFNLPDDHSKHLILIGPGTGISPFIGFLHHRAMQKSTLPDVTFGEIWLFYGCRYAERDFLFRSELEKFSQGGILSKLFLSFSRDSNKENGARYVQDNLKKHAKSLAYKILVENSMIYVCGDGKNMARDVLEAFETIISSETKCSVDEARDHLVALQKERIYKQDVWI